MIDGHVCDEEFRRKRTGSKADKYDKKTVSFTGYSISDTAERDYEFSELIRSGISRLIFSNEKIANRRWVVFIKMMKNTWISQSVKRWGQLVSSGTTLLKLTTLQSKRTWNAKIYQKSRSLHTNNNIRMEHIIPGLSSISISITHVY